MGEKLRPPLLLCLFMAKLPHFLCKLPETKGFSLKLVQRDISDNSSHFLDTISPTITRSSFLYTIDATIGTPSRKRSFIFDTGSSLTWTQCRPCIRCFKQDYPIIDPKKSTSYKKLSPNHPLARFFNRSNNGECIFNVSYESGQSSAGVGSIETFTLPSNKNSSESIKDIVFGCTNSYQGQFTSNTLVSGIMGMNKSPLSLIGQMGSISVRQFSYCLPRINSPVKATYLRFGNDVMERGSFQKTSFVRTTNDYSVKIVNISIAGRVLKLPKSTFSKGCILDIGSGASRLEMGAHIPVLSALKKHFEQFNLTRLSSDRRSQGDLCYRLLPGFKNYPSMTLHFEGANLEIGPENLFRFINDRFCLALFGTPQLTILGAYQQQNVRFIYDIGNEKLLFAKEDCSKDKAN